MSSDPVGSIVLPPDTSAFSVEFEEKRSRLTSFFRFITVIPHIIFLYIYMIGAFFAVIGAWFALVFTAKYPEGIYNFMEGYVRYYGRVMAYAYLATDKFPPFGGNPAEHYAAHLSVGPPKDKYSRWKAFFRGILVIPFAIVAYILMLIYELVAIVAWFAILFTGKQSKGLQDAMIFGLSYNVRLMTYHTLMTEAWPTQITDESNDQHLAALGVTPPTITETTPVAPVGAEPPAPPAPPEPPAAPEPPAPA